MRSQNRVADPRRRWEANFARKTPAPRRQDSEDGPWAESGLSGASVPLMIFVALQGAMDFVAG
jgi:hypothetical protein